jgi:hypothetical protein
VAAEQGDEVAQGVVETAPEVKEAVPAKNGDTLNYLMHTKKIG